MARLVHLLYVDTRNHDALVSAKDIDELAEGWRALFRRRIETSTIEDWQKRLNL